MPSPLRRVVAPTAVLALALSLLVACGGGDDGGGATTATTAPAGPPAVAEYDLGTTTLPQPLSGRFARLPVRLRGVLGVPDGPGPHPVVLVAHGAHGDNCPAGPFDSETWPCDDRETRSDLGMRDLVEALAARGYVAIAPGMNAVYTGGWGEPLGELRWGQVADTTLGALADAGAGAKDAFGVPVEGRLDMGRLGVVGHSRGGAHALAWAAARDDATGGAEVAAGRGRVGAVLMVAPAWLAPSPLPDVPVAMVQAACDGDVGQDPGRRYLAEVRAADGRTAPFWDLVLAGADHVSFNRLLTEMGRTDPAPVTTGDCAPARRITPAQQRAWLGEVAADVMDAGLRDRPAPWMTAPFPDVLYGRAVAITQAGPASAGG